MLRFTLITRNYPKPVLRKASAFPHFDLCIIGAGPAGFAAAVRAIDYGKRVCIIEENRMGGADLWSGSLPSKMLWELSATMTKLHSSEFSRRFLKAEAVEAIRDGFDEQKALKSLQSACEEREGHLKEFLKHSGVTCIQGKASFANENEVDVMTVGTREYHTVSADNFIIATGCSPIPLTNYPFDHKVIVSHSDMFRLPIPSSLVIVGGGILGCEFASVFSQLGKTKVYLIDHMDRIMGKEDDDVAASVDRTLRDRGVTIFNNSTLFDLEATTDEHGKPSCQFAVQSKDGGRVNSVVVDRALVSVGRAPNLEGLGLENTSMKVKNGSIVRDEQNRCYPYKHIFCVGDASSNLRVVNMAQASARVTVNNMFGHSEPVTANEKTMSNMAVVMFFGQEVACIGLNEKMCQERRISYTVAKVKCEYLPRPLIIGDREGFVKLIVSNDSEKRVLGARAVCPHAGSVVEVVSLAVRYRSSVYGLLKLNMAYPSVSQAMMECILTLSNHNRTGSSKGVEVSSWSPPTE